VRKCLGYQTAPRSSVLSDEMILQEEN
jgi:hypothetical protein